MKISVLFYSNCVIYVIKVVVFLKNFKIQKFAPPPSQKVRRSRATAGKISANFTRLYIHFHQLNIKNLIINPSNQPQHEARFTVSRLSGHIIVLLTRIGSMNQTPTYKPATCGLFFYSVNLVSCLPQTQ